MVHSILPSKRSLKYAGYDSYTDVNDIVDDDMYHVDSNPNGIINLGTTVNPLMRDLVQDFTETKYKINPSIGATLSKPSFQS